MKNPLRLLCLLSLAALFFTQVGLLLVPGNINNWYWIAALSLPLLLPLKGFIANNLYTYRWAGFLTLFYFCVGISELVSTPELRIYAYLTTILSIILFIGVIYYSRWLGLQKAAKRT